MTELRVDVPPEAVFAAICDLAHWDEWLPLHSGWPDGIPEHLGEGARFRQELGLLGVRDTVTVTVTEHRSPVIFAIFAEGNHGADLDLTFRIEPAGKAGSVVTVEPRIIGNLSRPVRILATRGLDAPLNQSLRRLERHIVRRAEVTS